MATEGTDVVITLEVPGVDVSDIDIEVAEGRLTISGRRRDRSEDRDDAGKVLVRELRYGAFRRTFQLPEGIGHEQIEAETDKGLLRLRIRNVTRPVQPPQKIEVRSGSTPQQKTIEARTTEEQAKS